MKKTIEEIKEEIKKKNERKKEVNKLLKNLKSEHDTLIDDLKILKEEKNLLELEKSNKKKLVVKDELTLFDFFTIIRKYKWIEKNKFIVNNYKYCIIISVVEGEILSKRMFKIDNSFDINIWNRIETSSNNEIFNDGPEMKGSVIRFTNNKTSYNYYPWENEFCSKASKNEFNFTFFIKDENDAMVKYNSLELGDNFILPIVSHVNAKEFNKKYQFFYKNNNSNFDIFISMNGIVVIKGTITERNLEELKSLKPCIFKEVS